MGSTKQETKTILTREDLVNILGGCNVVSPSDNIESCGTNRIRQKHLCRKFNNFSNFIK